MAKIKVIRTSLAAFAELILNVQAQIVNACRGLLRSVTTSVTRRCLLKGQRREPVCLRGHFRPNRAKAQGKERSSVNVAYVKDAHIQRGRQGKGSRPLQFETYVQRVAKLGNVFASGLRKNHHGR